MRLLHILLVTYSVAQAIAGEIQCKSSPDYCICSTVQANHESQCPMDFPDISMAVSPNREVYVQCNEDIQWNSSHLPLIEVGNSLSVKFRNCSFPRTNFLSVMQKLGVNSTKSLKIDFSSFFQNTPLTADYFVDLHDLEKLLLVSNNIRDIDESAFRTLSNLTVLDLSDNRVNLLPNLFTSLSSLTVLELSRNNISDLPPEIFQNLTNLRMLNIWANKLTALDGEMFSNLRNLQSVEFMNNEIEALPGDVFHNLANLSNLSFAKNYLQSLPEDLFSRNKALYFINLSRNERLASLPGGLFANLTKLHTVYLNGCNFTSLPGDLFEGSTSLHRIDLQMNRLTHLPEEIFKAASKLHDLNLSHNKLTDLPDQVFSSLSQLKTLNLENNMLENISRSLFVSLYNLERINLQNNRIGFMHYQAFQAMAQLKTLKLAHNFINFQENYFDTSPFTSNVKLVEVDLSYNNITSVSEDWMISKTFLEELNLSHNQITYVEFRDMMAVSGMLKMDLTYNQIASVDFTLAELIASSQEHIDAFSSNAANNVVFLNDNPIQCDCYIHDFIRYFERDIDPRVPTLVTVVADSLTCSSPYRLRDFSVQKLRTSLLTCSLEEVHVNNTCPDSCECWVRLWDQAFIVNCMQRNLKTLPKIVLPEFSIINQTIVHLQGNLLREGPKPKMGYENVTKLYLSANNINEITWIPPKLEILNLDNNNISYIGNEVIAMLNVSTLRNISLGGNPWNCDCKLMDLNKFLVSQLSNKHIDSSHIKCINNGKPMVNLSANDLCPTYMALVLSLSITLALVALVVAIAAALYYRNEQEIKVWLFAHNMLLWFVTEEEVDKEKLYDAFISYSHKDEDFVLNDLISVLEQGPQPYKLCLHIRDWIAGEFIPKQIARSVEDSRRTVVILSSSFLQSVWGKMEFRTAHTQAMAEGRARVIVILYGDINVENDLDDELKAYIKTNTYVKWGDPWFWDKLRYALPHSRVKLGKKAQKNQNIMISLNDKLDLINSIPTTPNPGSTPPAINMDPLLLKNNPLDFRSKEALTPPAEAGLNPLLVTVTK